LLAVDGLSSNDDHPAESLVVEKAGVTTFEEVVQS
jgi:hypothetical protein